MREFVAFVHDTKAGERGGALRDGDPITMAYALAEQYGDDAVRIFLLGENYKGSIPIRFTEKL